MQFEYLRRGFHPEWDRDPYRVFAYTTVQERATQFSHSETGRIVSRVRASAGRGPRHVAKDEARHYAFYRSVFEEILKRDPDQALHSASFILPAIDMPGVTMPGLQGPGRSDPAFGDLRARATICGSCRSRSATGRSRSSRDSASWAASPRRRSSGIPARLKRIAEHMETRSKAKTFSFEVVFSREFAME